MGLHQFFFTRVRFFQYIKYDSNSVSYLLENGLLSKYANLDIFNKTNTFTIIVRAQNTSKYMFTYSVWQQINFN